MLFLIGLAQWLVQFVGLAPAYADTRRSGFSRCGRGGMFVGGRGENEASALEDGGARGGNWQPISAR